MADSGGGIKGSVAEITQTVKEVTKDVKDEVGQMIEANVQTATGPKLTPQQQQQKKQEEEEQLARARKVIQYYKDLSTNIKKAQEERKQRETQRLQQMQQEEEAKKAKQAAEKQPFLPPQGKQDLREDIARTQAERSKGRGVGG